MESKQGTGLPVGHCPWDQKLTERTWDSKAKDEEGNKVEDKCREIKPAYYTVT